MTAKALWIIPQDVQISTSQLKEIAKTLDIPLSELRKKLLQTHIRLPEASGSDSKRRRKYWI